MNTFLIMLIENDGFINSIIRYHHIINLIMPLHHPV
jgi:hypothetical protein